MISKILIFSALVLQSFIECAAETKTNVNKKINSNFWYLTVGASFLVVATFASFLVYSLKRKRAFTDLTTLPNSATVNKETSEKEAKLQKIDETLSNNSIHSIYSLNDKFQQCVEITRNQSATSDPTHNQSKSNQFTLQRSQTIDNC